MSIRLNKHISETGACSRREADRLIGEGRVTVNGIRARVGAVAVLSPTKKPQRRGLQGAYE